MPWKPQKQYRLPGYDYAQNGAYFITIVTKDRQHYFGEIINGTMTLSPIGAFTVENIAYLQTVMENVCIPEWEVMPNHIHLIISLKNIVFTKHQFAVGIQPLPSNSISSIVNHFKGKIKRWCNQNGHEFFNWQSRFHDRVIRDEHEYFAIANYIRNNIGNWEKDVEK